MQPALTRNLQLIVAHLHAQADEQYAAGLHRATGVSEASTFSVLRTLEQAGLATRRVEAENTADPSKPPRVWYRLTEAGHRFARTISQPEDPDGPR